jgi:bla regulator protein blaR1
LKNIKNNIMKNLQTLFETPLAGIFGQTMLHSLWQGVIVVAVYFIASRFISSAKGKVWLGISTFTLQFGLSIATFILLKPNPSATSELISSEVIGINFTNILNVSQSQSYLDLIQQNAHWMAVGWIIGFTFLMLRQLGGLAYIQYLKTTGIENLSEKAKTALDNILNKIDDRVPSFRAFESDKVNTAMVLGFLKPIILIPSIFVSGLSREQLELIFAHEIAHIKRYDFLLNLGQTLLENLFFFHPAFWIVSHQIRENREHACDDWAAELTGEKVLLAKTLAQIQLQSHSPQLAMAFGKKRMPMLNRIQRLLGVAPQNHKVKLTAVLLMLASICTFGFVQNQQEITSKIERIIYNDAELGIDIKDTEPVEMPNIPAEVDAFEPIRAIERKDSSIQGNIEYNMGSEGKINFKTDKYDVKIEPSGIIVNGVKQKLSSAQKKELAEHFKAIKTSNERIQLISKDMQVYATEIQKIHTDAMVDVNVNPQNDPAFKKGLEEIQEYSKKIAQEAVAFQTAIKKLNPKDANYDKQIAALEKEFEGKVEKHEIVMENIEIDMSDFEKKMEKIQLKIEQDLEVPMRKIELKMEAKEGEIDKYADELEKHHEALIKMLPKDVQDHLGNDFYNGPHKMVHPPKPPRPIAPNKITQPAKPAKPMKEEKLRNHRK